MPRTKRSLSKRAALRAAPAKRVTTAAQAQPFSALTPAAALKPHAGPQTRRWIAQRWTIDNSIRSVGVDWDQPRSMYLSAPIGVEANADFAMVRERIKKLADASPVFETIARRRENKAAAAEKSGETVTARDNYFMASIHWGAAQWPIDENDAQNRFYNQRKRECYTKYASLADHRVQEAWIAVHGQKIPAWFHLPYNYRGGRVPVVIAIPGMDSFKESSVALYGDRFLNRGMAVLAIDGPGQYESAVLDIPVSMEAWMETGRACVEWLLRRREIDAGRIGMSGTSFGTFFGTIAAAHEPRIRALAQMSVCHEPGFHSIFEEASPTFKMRFMYMSGYTDEEAFDEFRKTLTWEGHAEKIRAPFLCVAGEWDELSPLAHTDNLMKAVRGRKRLVIYQECRHSVGNAASTNLGPFPPVLVADWMAATLNGKTFPNERWYVQSNGVVLKMPF